VELETAKEWLAFGVAGAAFSAVCAFFAVVLLELLRRR
jgi:hypothetical protein